MLRCESRKSTFPNSLSLLPAPHARRVLSAWHLPSGTYRSPPGGTALSWLGGDCGREGRHDLAPLSRLLHPSSLPPAVGPAAQSWPPVAAVKLQHLPTGAGTLLLCPQLPLAQGCSGMQRDPMLLRAGTAPQGWGLHPCHLFAGGGMLLCWAMPGTLLWFGFLRPPQGQGSQWAGVSGVSGVPARGCSPAKDQEPGCAAGARLVPIIGIGGKIP